MKHNIAPIESQDALESKLPIRQTSSPSASDAAEKPPPCTVSGVPPSDGAADGDTWLTAAAGWYVYRAPPAAYCCPFIESSTGAPPGACTGDAHSSCDSST